MWLLDLLELVDEQIPSHNWPLDAVVPAQCGIAHFVGDAAHLEDRNRLERIVSTDKSDIYSNRDKIQTILGIRIVYIKDEFAEPALPSES